MDLVVTDPPFFDNVHYSELADFFFAWQRLGPSPFVNQRSSTRHAEEVQDASAEQFSRKLRAVFGECHRVLSRDGLLIFTYHQSRADGWTSLAEAVVGAGFDVVNAHPLKAEMSVAAAMRLLTEGSEGAGHQVAQEATQLAFFERAKPVKRGRQESAARAPR